MRPLVLTVGILLLIFGIYPPFSLPTFLAGSGITLLGLFSTKKVKK